MAFSLPELPYAMDALAPVMSRETLEFHYGKHHKAYVDKLNKLTKDTDLEKKTLEELIVNVKQGDIFNQAAQVWNHTFFWNGMSPGGGRKPTGAIAPIIERQFGSFDNFKAQFSEAGLGQFGSGWVWLTKLANGALSIEKTSNADTPLAHGHTPLLTCDVWEHAYYIDYRNDRARFINSFWDVVNWDHVNKCFASR